MIEPQINLMQKLQNKFISYKIRHHHEIEGFLSENEARALYKTAALLPKESIIVEIGSWKGKSTYCLANGLKEGKIIAIDPFDSSGEPASEQIYREKQGEQTLLEQFLGKMNKFKLIHKIEVFQGFSEKFVGKIDKIDLLFIDGDHSKESCEFDFTNYHSAITKGGYLLLHDYYPSRKDLGPTWVVDNRVIPSGKYEFIGLFDSLWIGKKL